MKPTRRQWKVARAHVRRQALPVVTTCKSLPHDVAAKLRSLRKRGKMFFSWGAGCVIVVATDMAWELL